MKTVFIFFTILFFTSTNLLAKTYNLLCQNELDFKTYPYKYVTLEIDMNNYVFSYSGEYINYYFDESRFEEEDVKKYDSYDLGEILWDANYIGFGYGKKLTIDLINLIYVDKNDVSHACKITKRQIN